MTPETKATPFPMKAKVAKKGKDIMPLKKLKKSSKYWTIKVRVSKRYPPRAWSSAKGSGIISSVDLIDRERSQIKATMFDETSRKWWSILEEGKVFYITSGSIRPCNPKFNTLGHPCEITLGSYSRIQKVEDDPQIPLAVFDLIPLEMLTQKDPIHVVDVQGIITDMGDCEDIMTKRQTRTQKRTVVLVDETGCDVDLTLWGDYAQKELSCNQIVRVTRCRINNYKDNIRLGSTFGSALTVVNDKSLLDWYTTAKRPFDHLSQSSKIHYLDPRHSIQDIKELKMEEGEIQMLQVRAIVEKVNVNIESPPWYKACPDCKNKLTDDEVEGYYCEKCLAPHSTYIPRYMLRVTLSDKKTRLTATMFDSHAEELVGKSAQEMDVLLQDDCTEEFSTIFSQVTGIIRLFKLKIQLSQAKEGELRFQYTILDLCEIQPSKEEQWVKIYGTKTEAEVAKASKELGYK